jgi:hypothetical protein
MTTETQTCPRRQENPHADHAFPGPDHWEADRWRDNPWPEQLGEPPRLCSFCGGAHPDDIIALLERGFEHERAAYKTYKGYIHEPGYGDYMRALLAAMQEDPESAHVKAGSAAPDRVGIPGPPVKLYIQHFTDEQRKRLNELLKTQHEHLH